jgi:predicted DNA-binding transcriptional regulator YafY
MYQKMIRLSYENVSRTTHITASRDLNDLVEKGVMLRFGSGRGVYYELRLDREWQLCLREQ